MIRWQGMNHPTPDPIVWTKRGLLIRTVARWVTVSILAVVFAIAMTHGWTY